MQTTNSCILMLAIMQNHQTPQNIKDATLNIPEPEKLEPSDEHLTPYVIIGDEAFGLSGNVLRPYGGSYLPPLKKKCSTTDCHAQGGILAFWKTNGEFFIDL
ncbi:hypothetical protein PR048_022423 [Dryococelus australis]|uniref:DDE Tnp4 domain-containing protein n=1 Tax=Dryococelus australis TaxID=614101 RepID=A0ABQ9H111_9NEOP|nr:hypothetical protein PR048_022423 [Dryococelus australis]